MKNEFDYSRGNWPKIGYLMCHTCGLTKPEDRNLPYADQADCPTNDGGQMMGRGWAGWDCENRRIRVTILKRAGLTEQEALRFLADANSELVKAQIDLGEVRDLPNPI